MAAAQRTVKPDRIKTLRDWAARWPKASNLGFDEETREPVVYSADASRTKVSTIPWKREGDTLTILATPSRFSAQATEAAKSRYGRFREQKAALTTAADEQLRILETAVLEAWRTYEAADGPSKPSMRREILSAEKSLREQEEMLATQIYRERAVQQLKVGTVIYVPPMPVGRRGIPLTAVAEPPLL